MNSILLATLALATPGPALATPGPALATPGPALATQGDAPRFAAPAVDADFRTRLAPVGERWLATSPDGTPTHCGALYFEGLAVDLYAAPVGDEGLEAYARTSVDDAVEWFEDEDVALLEEVEFAGLQAFDVVLPSLSPNEAFGYMMLDEADRDGIDLPYAASRLVDRDGVRYEFMTDPAADREAALALLRSACEGWTFDEGDVTPRPFEAGELASGAGWSLTGRTLDEAISGARFQLPDEDWDLGAEPPWTPSTGEVLAALVPFPSDESVPAGSVYVRRSIAPGVLEDGELAWPERADTESDQDLADALREAFPDAPFVAAFMSPAEELFGESYPAMWIARVVVDAGDGAWTFIDAEVVDWGGVDPADWAVDWIAEVLDGREALPEARREELVAAARTRRLDVGNRRWDGRVLRDLEVGVTWTAPDGVWAPASPVEWAVPDEARRFDATWLDGGIRVELDVARDLVRSFERAARRGVQRTVGGYVDADTLPDPIEVDAQEGVEMVRFELEEGVGDGRAGVIVVARVERQVVSMAATCAAGEYRDRLEDLRAVCAGLRIDPEAAARSVWVDDDAFVDLEIGYAFDAPGEGWAIDEDLTHLDDKGGYSACAWRDDATDAWLGISANDVGGLGLDGDAYDALTLSLALQEFDDGFERSTSEIEGLTVDLVSGTRGDDRPVTVTTFRRGTIAYSMTLSGHTEQFSALAALRRFRFVE